jgi:hypothetical protein
MARVAARRLQRVHRLHRVPARPPETRIVLRRRQVGGDGFDPLHLTQAMRPEADARGDDEQRCPQMAADVIESFCARERAGQPAGDRTREVFIDDAAGMLLDQVARRKLPASQMLLIKRIDRVHRTFQ